jgi:hypothetical protein
MNLLLSDFTDFDSQMRRGRIPLDNRKGIWEAVISLVIRDFSLEGCQRAKERRTCRRVVPSSNNNMARV